MIIFNFKEKTVKIGCLEPVPLRVLSLEVKLDTLKLEVDKKFLNGLALPGLLGAYENSQEDPDEEEGGDLEAPDDRMAAEGMCLDLVLWQPAEEIEQGQLEKDLETLMDECGGELDEEHDGEPYSLESMENDGAANLGVEVDEDGHIVVNNEDIEVVKGEEPSGACSHSPPNLDIVYIYIYIFLRGERRPYLFFVYIYNIFYLWESWYL